MPQEAPKRPQEAPKRFQRPASRVQPLRWGLPQTTGAAVRRRRRLRSAAPVGTTGSTACQTLGRICRFFQSQPSKKVLEGPLRRRTAAPHGTHGARSGGPRKLQNPSGFLHFRPLGASWAPRCWPPWGSWPQEAPKKPPRSLQEAPKRPQETSA